LEAGYGDPSCAAHPGAIAVTQPRRVAVTSTATRVADELNVKLGEEVGYQVRYDKKVTTERDGTTQDAPSSKTTKIKFMTDGVLLKEMQSDLLLRKYSVVVIDEAHERGVNTDILLGLLSRVVPLRAELFREKRPGITPLRLVVMSATLRVSEFVENKKLCPTPPALLRIAARQFPVTIHFARETIHGDYVGAARKKVVAIHKKLPPGGILVFVTGQREVDQLVRKLKAAYPKPSSGVNSLDDAKESDKKTKTKQDSSGHELDAFSVDALDAAGEDFDDDFGGEDTKGDGNFDGGGRDDFDNDDDSDDSASDVSEEDDVVVHGGEGVTPDEAKAAEESWFRAHAPTTELANKGGSDAGEKEEDTGPGYLHVLPLYAMLPPDLQKRVFDPPPPGARVVVVATNVAETSLTIPNTRYVIDCGREKRRVFNSGGDGESEDGDASATNAGMSRFEVGWISKASAEQRCGRAGRTGPGHAYRLFSSAHFVNDLDDHAPPSILTQPVDGVVLQMRAMGIDRVARFPFLTPPNFASLKRAQRTLALLGALRPTLSVTSVTSQNPQTQTFGHFGSFGDDGDVGVLTELGRAMAALPIGPRHARMLLAAAASENSKNGGGCLAAAVVAAAALSLDSPFLRDEFAGGDTSGDAKDDKEAAQRRRKLRHAFHHPHSDALSAARALVAYDTQRGPREAAAFCLDHCLHGRTMREASDLRRQLLRALTSNSVASAAFGKPARAELARARAFVNLKVKVGEDPAARALRVSWEGGDTKDGKSGTQKGTSDADGDGGKKDASTDVSSPGDVSLRKALLCGWADRVVRRVKRGEETDAERDAGGKTKATRYKPALLQSTVYLHPSSALHKTSPEYAAYCDLQRTEKRAYLGGATAVDAGWLTDHASALCTLGPALQDPPPRYVQHKGHVVQFTQPHFGSHRWKLPLRASPCSVDDSLGYGAFAAALLSGAVSAPFGDLRDRLCAKPVLCARPEGKTQRRVGELVHQLTHRKVCTKASLRAQWEKDPKWLLQQARDWMRKGHEHALERLWPRIVAFVLMEGGGGDRTGVGFTEAVDTGSGLEREGGLWGLNCVSGDGVASSKASAKEKKEKNPAGPKKRKNNPAALDAGLSIWD
jgi:ATP-dependent RNA helicase DHX37/DHR1